MIVSFMPTISVAATGEVAAPTGTIKQGTTYNIVSPSRFITVFGAYAGGDADGKLQDGGDGYCVTDGWYLRSGYSTKTTNDGLIALLMTLDKEATIGGIEIVGHSSTGNDMTDFDVQALVNGEWVEVLSVDSNPFTSGNRTKMYTFTPVITTQVRILVNKCEALECKLGEVSLFEISTGNLSKKIDLTDRVTANNPDANNPVSFAVDGDKSTFLQNFHFPGMVNINLTTADNQPTAVDHFAMYLARGNNYYPTAVAIYIQKTPGGSLEEIGRYSTNWSNNNGLDSLYGTFDQTYMAYAIQVMVTSGVGESAFIPEIELYQYEREPDPTTPTKPEPTQTPTQAPTQAPTETRPPIPDDPDPDYLTYTVSNGEATITACDANVSGEITLPYYLGGYPVTTIGENAFRNCDNLTGVIIPNSVLNISNCAFAYCDVLVNITIPNSVKSIGNQAFVYCQQLSSIVIPDSVTSIGNAAFMSCENLTSVTLPEGLTKISNSMFSYCDNLININIPKGITSIGDHAFSECNKLSNITFPNSLISIGNCAFSYCYLTNISIPCGVSTIGDYAFSGCLGLSTVVLSNGIMSIGEDAFNNCFSLTSIIYCGTETQWNAISIAAENEKLLETPRAYHQYSSPCDGICNLCGGTRIPSAHKYASDCDASCNVCGETRIPKEHQYSNDCDSSCNFCGAYRKPSDHKYTNSCDTTCNTCGAERSITHNFEDVVTKATLSLNGKIETTCSVCGHTSSTTVISCPTSITLSKTSYVYNGAVNTPDVTVKDANGKTLVKGTDYTVTYPSGRTALGTYTITITMKGNYSGTKKLTFNIKLGTPAVTVANATNGVKVSWNKVSGAKNYTVYRAVYSGGKWSGWTAIKTGVTGTTYTDTSLKSNANVKYTVRAFNGSHSSTYKASSSIKFLAAPTVTVSNAANGVKITWNAIAGAKNYKVYKSVYTNGAWSGWKAIKTGVTGTTYTDTSVKSNDNVKYTVRAFNGNFSSTFKSSSSIKFLATPTVKAANAAKGVTITWNKIAGAKTYTVYRAVYSGGKWSGWTEIKTGVTGTSYTDTTVKSGATVRYTVKAINGNFRSNVKTGNTIKYLAQPKVTVAKVSNGIKASWGKITGASGYIVYRRTYANGKWSGWTAIKTTTAVSFTDTTAKKGVTYQYTVRAYSGDYRSSYINSSSIKR